MFKNARNFLQKQARDLGASIGTGLMIAGASAQAAVDVSAITDVLTDVAAVAAAVFGVFVAVKAAKLIRRAL